MSALTAEQLLDAIRAAATLAELKRLAGPSPAQSELARQRLATLDAMDRKTDSGALTIAEETLYRKLLREQTDFESLYGDNTK
jgi:hypothetical protein